MKILLGSFETPEYGSLDQTIINRTIGLSHTITSFPTSQDPSIQLEMGSILHEHIKSCSR